MKGILTRIKDIGYTVKISEKFQKILSLRKDMIKTLEQDH